MLTPTATIFLPYHALDDVILRGTRAAQPAAADVVPGTLYCVTDESNRLERSTGTVWELYAPTGGGGGAPDPHAPTHAVGGSDPVNLLNLAGYPGGSTLFLRADNTFALPPGGGVAAHHLTHETGGTDQVVNLSGAVITSGTVADARLSANVALENITNTFTQDQIMPDLLLSGPNPQMRANTVDGADNASVQICGGGGSTSGRGAYLTLSGNEQAIPGTAELWAGLPSGRIAFGLGGSLCGTMHPSGGFSWGDTIDPAANNLSAAGGFISRGSTGTALTGITATGGSRFIQFQNSQGSGFVGLDTSTGSDFAVGSTAPLVLYSGTAGGLSLVATAGAGSIRFYMGITERGRMHASGGFSWASPSDPGLGAFNVGGGGRTAGTQGLDLNAGANGLLAIGSNATGPTNLALFANPNGVVGYIQVSGTTTAFGTTSDARLKTDRGPLVSDVLARLRVRAFDWTADGTPGRGLFAQEAIAVAPFAVSVGTDEVDEQGLLKAPWGVDYSKLVPDLIVGWQQHAAKIAVLDAVLARLTDKGLTDAH